MRPTPGELPLGASAKELSENELRDKIDYTLDTIYEQRVVTLQDHAAWQILHGALAYKQQFMVETPEGKQVSAVDHILSGGKMNGWTVEPGILFDESTGRRGLRTIMEPGSKTGQGHHDQWLAILAQCGLPADHPIQVGDEQYSVDDLVAQVQADIHRNTDREYSWTLIGLTSYVPVDRKWIAFDGSEWSIEQLVRAEGEQVGEGACGGTHRLIGLAMTFNRHLAQGGKMTPLWTDIDDRLQEAIRRAKVLQNPDHSLSTNYFVRGGSSPDLATNLAATGHTLEFLALAMNEEQIHEPWVERTVLHLCELFRQTEKIPLECGALYHAAHGLALYRERMFGPREISPTPSASPSS